MIELDGVWLLARRRLMYDFAKEYSGDIMKYAPLLLLALVLTACGKTEAPANPVDAVARRTCMDTIEARATNPKSIAYAKDEQAVGRSKPDGKLDVIIKFSAKNELGIASSLVASCVVSADGKTLADIQVKDGR